MTVTMTWNQRATRVIALTVVLSACSSPPPQVDSVTPDTACANLETTLTITGSNLNVMSVTVGNATPDGGVEPMTTSTQVEGDATTVTVVFAADTLIPGNDPYDVIVTNADGQQATVEDVLTVVPGIEIAAVDPSSVWSGVDFPTSIFGNGMGDVNSVAITLDGTTTQLTGVTPVNVNRVDAIVPQGLPAGVYDVHVTDTHGCEADLPGALTVVTDLTVSVCAVDPIFGYDQVDTDITITSTEDGSPGGATCGGLSTTFSSTPRAWLNVGGQLEPLSNLAFLSEGSLTATVPANLTAGGPYDIIVQNPDGSVGVAAAAFTVVDMPVPEITSLDPPVIPSNFTGTYKIFGRNFRDPVRVEVYGPSGTLVNVPNATVVSATEVDLNGFDPTTLNLPVGASVVRVTNTDQETYGEYTAMAIISASFNIVGWTDVTSTPLPSPLMRQGAAAGQISLASRYMYVVGGDSGGATPARSDRTQIASIDKFGNIASWFEGRYRLPEARTSLQLVSVPSSTGRGGYLYAIGGNAESGTVATVSRAKILLPEDAPQITRGEVGIGGQLERGTFDYRVSAVMSDSDAANPTGETLPSDEIAAHTIPEGLVTLEWMPVENAASYRIYRTSMVNGVSGTEVLLADGVTETTFVDDGSTQTSEGAPLRRGELGVWVEVSALGTARRSMGAALAHDSTGAAYLYAIGGDTGTGATVAAGEVLDTYEYASVTDDGLTLGSWTAGSGATGTLDAARTRLQAAVGEHTTSPDVPAGVAYVYAVGGFDGTALVESYQAASVEDGGALTWGTTINSNGILQGLASIAASNQLFALGGENASGVPQKIAKSNIYSTPPAFGPTLNTNSAAASDVTGTPTIASFAALVFTSAHFYLLGGTTNGTDAIPRVWSNVY